jgi:RNA polymerase sigma factor (sigma-70 family)
MNGGMGKHPVMNPGLHLVGPAREPAGSRPAIDVELVLREAFSLAARTTNSVEDALDLALFAGEAWLGRTQTDPEFLRDSDRITGFIATCLRNRQIDLYKQRIVREAAKPKLTVEAESNVPAWADPAAVQEITERRTAVRAAVERLSEPRRRMVSLLYFEDQTRTEIAACFHLSLGAVAKQLGRAYEELRPLLADYAPQARKKEQA